MTAFDKKINQIATRHRWNIEKQARAAVPCYIIAAPTYEDTGKIVAVLNRCKGLYHETLTPIHYESWAVKVTPDRSPHIGNANGKKPPLLMLSIWH